MLPSRREGRNRANGAGAAADGVGRERPIRILWLIKGLGPGGAENLLALAADVRDRRRFHYEAAYLLPWKNALVERIERSGVPVHCLDGGSPHDLRWVARLRRLLRSGRFDLVHVHSPYAAAFARILCATLPRRTRPRVVSTEHLPWSGHARPTRALNMATFPLGEASIAVSEGVRSSIPSRLRDRVHVIVHGISLDRMRSELPNRDAARAELGAQPHEVLVGTVANLTAQKGYPYLLEAARIVIGRGVPARFVAVGQGPLEEEVGALHSALGLGERFLLLGYRDNPARVLAACDVFVLASLYEGQPLAVMEAMAMGLPIVATDVSGTREMVEDGVQGTLVPPGRPDLLAAAIVGLAGSPQTRARMAAAALDRSQAFDIARATAAIESIYRTIVGAGGSSKVTPSR